MEGSPATAVRPPPAFPAPPHFFNFSSLGFILSLLAIVTVVPTLIYTVFFAANCPLLPSRWRRCRPEKLEASDHTDESIKIGSDVKYEKERHEKDVGSECPVCLAVFAEEEDVKQLSGCNHSFHASCINLWLSSHSNCPVCRAPVNVKRPKTRSFSARDDGDRHQGLPASQNNASQIV